MLENDLELLVKAAYKAAEIAIPFANGAVRSWEKGDDAGPVTEADLAVNQMLSNFLRSKRPDYGWLSEESEDDMSRISTERCFVIDPIDGTRSFIKGEDTWAHSFAIAECGEPIAAVIFLPILDCLYCAEKGKGATLNGKVISVSKAASLSGANILAARPALDVRFWKDGLVPQFNRFHRPSLAYRLSLVADGQYDGMITFRDSWEWDVCAGALITSEAGAMVTDVFGDLLIFNQRLPMTKGVVSAAPYVHSEFLARSDPH